MCKRARQREAMRPTSRWTRELIVAIDSTSRAINSTALLSPRAIIVVYSPVTTCFTARDNMRGDRAQSGDRIQVHAWHAQTDLSLSLAYSELCACYRPIPQRLLQLLVGWHARSWSTTGYSRCRDRRRQPLSVWKAQPTIPLGRPSVVDRSMEVLDTISTGEPTAEPPCGLWTART